MNNVPFLSFTKQKQQVFNTVARHLLTQNKKALSDSGVCLFRGQQGTKCAVGCLIPDSVYTPALEATHLYKMSDELFARMWPNYDSGNRSFVLNFFYELQRIHDSISVRNWREELEGTAFNHGLNVDVLKEFNHEQEQTMNPIGHPLPELRAKMQLVYDKVVVHLLTQRRKAKTNRCLYRTPDGLKCAVGALIPDELYKPELEDYPFSSMPNGLLEKMLPGYEVKDSVKWFSFLGRLQNVHDGHKIEVWPEQLRVVGVLYNFNLDVLDRTLAETASIFDAVPRAE